MRPNGATSNPINGTGTNAAAAEAAHRIKTAYWRRFHRQPKAKEIRDLIPFVTDDMLMWSDDDFYRWVMELVPGGRKPRKRRYQIGEAGGGLR